MQLTRIAANSDVTNSVGFHQLKSKIVLVNQVKLHFQTDFLILRRSGPEILFAMVNWYFGIRNRMEIPGNRTK